MVASSGLARWLVPVLVAFPSPVRAVVSAAQATQDNPPSASSSGARVAVESARRALERGDRVEAARHAQAALELEPASTGAFEMLLRACGDDRDARTLWSHDLAAASADAKGKFKAPKELAALVAPKDAAPAALASARAAACDELLQFAARCRKEADKELDRVVWTSWAEELARQAAYPSPSLVAQSASAADLIAPVSRDAQRGTLEALSRKLSSAQASGDVAATLDVALVLRGLASQAAFEDLEGPLPPALPAAVSSASDVLARARDAYARSNTPLSIEALEALDGDQREAFTREHRSFASPGLALTPNARYRVETTCGYTTLLGVARVAELHHQRLVRWFGSDPFLERQGVIRVTPESAGLESEGAPFWWVGGFQGGDVTTLRFSCGTIEGFGRGLTHELTHRFDGALHPGIPAWLAEGRAVWTAAAYAGDGQDFVDSHALFGTIDDTRFRGYGGRAELEKLVRGTIADYRDNYVAGYALFVFLESWGEENAPPKYARALDKFMDTRRTDKRDAFDAFEAHFCDGLEGRPKDFGAFTAEFRTWIEGFYWLDRKPFTKRYVESPGPAPQGDLVLDEPTWVWSRARAEPWFGQDQARAAGDLLARLGDERGALSAYVWSLAVDEPDSLRQRRLAELFDAVGKREAAWILRRRADLRDGVLGADAAPGPLLAKLPRVRAWLAELEEAVQSYSSAGLELTAAALAAEHDAVVRLAGGVLLAAGRAAPKVEGRVHPFEAPGRAPIADGWVEDKLTDYERHREDGAWFVDEHDSLHIGRNQPRKASGPADREARLHHVFVRSAIPLGAGRYSIRARITPTTSFVSGAIVLGYQRRDRNLRVGFSGGDYDYSIGEKDEAAELDAIGWSIGGAFERDSGLSGSLQSGAYGFGRAISAFNVELLVDGGSAFLSIEGERVGVYHTPTALDVSGFFGFATSMGDFKVSDLVVRRLDRGAHCGDALADVAPWNLARVRAREFSDLRNRAVLGAPRHPQGTLLLSTPEPSFDADPPSDPEELLNKLVERAAEFDAFRARYSIAIPAYVLAPAAMGEAWIARARAALAELERTAPAPAELLVFGPAALDELRAARAAGDLSDARQAKLLFIDSAGVLRLADGFHRTKRLEGVLERWLEVFRNR